MNTTINFYNKNAKNYFNQTINSDMKFLYDKFEKLIFPNATILDLGCGAGRDTNYFSKKGYSVTSIDGSKELCNIAKQYTKLPIRELLFENLDYINEFDAIWACASLLHIPSKNLPSIITKCLQALKTNGVFYLSFKYGSFEGQINDRYFTYFTQDEFQKFLLKFPEFKIIELTLTNDVRKERQNEKWLNCFLKKIS